MTRVHDPIYERHRDLVAEVLAQGVRDARRGDPGAIAWIVGHDFDYWCNWVDVDPAAARDALLPTLPYQLSAARRQQLRGDSTTKPTAADRDNEGFIRSFVKCYETAGKSLTVHLARPGYPPTRNFNGVTLCEPETGRGLIKADATHDRQFDPARDLSAICPGCAAVYQKIAAARLGARDGARIVF